MRPTWLLIFLLALPVYAIRRTKFQHWFPKYENLWIEAVKGPCQQEVTNYLRNNRTYCEEPCACAADCILQNATGTVQSNFASAQVLLGLVPVTLAVIGPTVAEISVLSTYRPLLALLLALGSPAVNISRAFVNVDIFKPLSRPRSAISQFWTTWFAHQPVVFRVLFRIWTYLIALAAIYNNIRNSVTTDMRTISGWRCASVYMPLAWSMLAVIVHGWGIIAIRVRLRKYSVLSFKSVLQSEIFKSISTTKDSILSESLFWMASVCAVVHMIYGILVLSSLVFISALEALQVLVLYAVSAILCQLILLLELANMNHELNI
jgi:hypothetical protein